MAARRLGPVLVFLAILGSAFGLGWAVFGGSGEPPTVHEAIGEIEQEDAPLRRVFEPNEAFSPLPEPGPGDWLAIHHEEPQTVAGYLAAQPNMPAPPRDVIYVLPIGALPAERGPTLDALVRYAHAYFGLAVRVLPPLDTEALEVTRREHFGHPQLNAADILDLLEPRLPEDAYCMIAVTWSDLYPDESYNFVFGLARLWARVGVFSFSRLHPDFYGEELDPGPDSETRLRRLVTRRALAVMSHEIGHMFGVHHCVFFSCNMNGSNSLEEADGQPLHLCPVCLRKLHLVLGFDPQRRYEALEHEYRELGLEREAAWVHERRAFIGGDASATAARLAR